MKSNQTLLQPAKPILITLIFLIANIRFVQAGDTLSQKQIKQLIDQTLQHLNGKQAESLSAINKRVEKIEKLEGKMHHMLGKVDTSAIQNLDAQWKQQLEKAGFIKIPGINSPDLSNNAQYFARFDSLEALLKFLKPENLVDPSIAEPLIQSIKKIKASATQLETFQKWLDNRELQWRALFENKGLSKLQIPKVLEKWKGEALACKLQIDHWKETLNNPEQIERDALKLLNKLPAFREFMSRNSELARLFGPPAGANDLPQGAPIPGLQTRASLAQELQSRFGSGALQSGGQLQQQLQNGMDRLSSLQQNPLTNLSIPNEKSVGNNAIAAPTPKQEEAAELKSKTFKQRLEFGWNLQSATRIQDFPAVRDVGLSLGYKVNPRSVIGVGVAYKFALGESWKDIEWTHEGIGLKSFVDWRIASAGSKFLQGFWLTGGFEMNYWSRIAGNAQWGDLAWEKSGLVGVTKVVKSKKKEGKVQIFYDFLRESFSYTSQGWMIRVGYRI